MRSRNSFQNNLKLDRRDFTSEILFIHLEDLQQKRFLLGLRNNQIHFNKTKKQLLVAAPQAAFTLNPMLVSETLAAGLSSA